MYNTGEIKRRVKISDYLAKCGIKVENGRCAAKWRGGERDSVAIDDDKGTWCDHGNDDQGGDLFKLVQVVEGLDFLPAVRRLCEQFNIFDERQESATSREVAHYDYTDENGKPIYRVIRKEPKDFRQAHYDANGKLVYNMKGVRRVLYHLPRLIEAVAMKSRIFIVEGEKDVENAEKLGLCATCNAGGAGKWSDDLSAFFKGAGKVVIFADRDNTDNDFKGQRHAEQVRESLERVAGVKASIVYVGDASCKDASDWICKGATADDFIAIADYPPPWVPQWQSQETTEAADAGSGDGAAQGEAPDLPRFGYPIADKGEIAPTVEGALRLASGSEVRLKATARGGISLCRAIETCLTQARQGSLTGEGSNRKETFDFKKDAAPVTHLATVLWMRSRGRLFYHAKTKARSDIYFFDNIDGRLIVMASDEFSSWLANETRINREDKAFKRLLSFVQDAAMPSEVSAGVIPQEYFAKKNGKIYISNGESYMVRCSPGKAEQVKNGTDEVLFLAEKTLLPWPFLCREAGLNPFDALEIFSKATYTARYGSVLLLLHYLNIFACHDTRPPLLLTGDRGAGKTKIAKGLMCLIGTPIRINGLDKKREDDFAVMMDNGGLLCLDNIEGEIVKAEWFESAIERVATEGGMETTEKYTHKLHTYQTRANLIITSKHPIFADNDGLTDRLIIIRLEVRDETKDAALFDEIAAKRAACLTWTAWTLADVLAVGEVKVDETINKRHPDFGAFSLKAGKVLGRYDAVLDALTSGEFDKTLLAIQMNPLAADILDAVLEHDNGHWSATATDIAKAICRRNGASEETEDIRELVKKIGSTLKRLGCSFRICFPGYRVIHPGGVFTHIFNGANPRLFTPENGSPA